MIDQYTQTKHKHTHTQHKPKDFKEDTSGTPHVHLLRIMSICQQTFGRSVPAGGDVFSVRRFGVDASARAKVCQLQHIILKTNIQMTIILSSRWFHSCVTFTERFTCFDQDVFWLHISVKYSIAGKHMTNRNERMRGGNVTHMYWVFARLACACDPEICTTDTCNVWLYSRPKDTAALQVNM